MGRNWWLTPVSRRFEISHFREMRHIASRRNSELITKSMPLIHPFFASFSFRFDVDVIQVLVWWLAWFLRWSEYPGLLAHFWFRCPRWWQVLSHFWKGQSRSRLFRRLTCNLRNPITSFKVILNWTCFSWSYWKSTWKVLNL